MLVVIIIRTSGMERGGGRRFHTTPDRWGRGSEYLDFGRTSCMDASMIPLIRLSEFLFVSLRKSLKSSLVVMFVYSRMVDFKTLSVGHPTSWSAGPIQSVPLAS